MELGDGNPRNYSSEDREEIKPPLPVRPTTRSSTCMIYKKLEGTLKHPTLSRKDINSKDFLTQLYVKLKPYSISTEQPDQLGIDTLNRHYESVFPVRRKKLETLDSSNINNNGLNSGYKVYIAYFKYDSDGVKQPRDTPYSIRIDTNKLSSVRRKAPFTKPDYRYFFKDDQNVYQEADSDNDYVPYSDIRGVRTIHCQVIMP